MDTSSAIAVVDIYDVFTHALAALGSARMPTPASVRRVCASLRLPAPTAVYATVPDIPDALLPTDDSARARGWRLRDEQFAESATSYLADGDPSTHAHVGELLVGERRATTLRRVATSTIADAYWAALTTRATVVLFSDRWDAVALQWHLRDLGVDRSGAVVRAGTRPLAVEDGPDAHVLLTDDLLATLVDAPRSWGRERRLELARIDRDGPPRRWVVVDLEPERDCAILVPAAEPARIDAVHRSSAASPGHEVLLDRLGLRLEDPAAVVPRLTTSGHPWPATITGTVVERFEPTAVLVDTTGDGRPDSEVATGRDTWPLPHGTRVRLAHTMDGLTYLGPEPPASDSTSGATAQTAGRSAGSLRPGVVEVTDTSEGRITGRRLDAGAVEVMLHALPGVALHAGDLVLVTELDQDRWTAISTHLPHLAP